MARLGYVLAAVGMVVAIGAFFWWAWTTAEWDIEGRVMVTALSVMMLGCVLIVVAALGENDDA